MKISSRASAHIVDVKNNVAESIRDHLIKAGFHGPDIDEADDISDEVILYTKIGKLFGRPQIMMVRIITDTDIQIQIPTRVANILGVKEFYKTGEASETVAVLNRIINAIKDKKSSNISRVMR
jgi:hypothetical protein